MQSLLVVFAHLVIDQLEALLSFLSQVPDPKGRSALEYVLVEWCQRHVRDWLSSVGPARSFCLPPQTCFCGVYEARVSTVALCQLLSHCLRTGDQRLGSIVIEGEDPVINGDGRGGVLERSGMTTADTFTHAGIRTRSRSRAEAKPVTTAFPLPVKLFKLLIGDLQAQLELREAEETHDTDEVSGLCVHVHCSKS